MPEPISNGHEPPQNIGGGGSVFVNCMNYPLAMFCFERERLDCCILRVGRGFICRVATQRAKGEFSAEDRPNDRWRCQSESRNPKNKILAVCNDWRNGRDEHE